MPTGRHHTPNFAEKSFANSHKNLEIHESFLLQKFPATRYCTVYCSTRNYPIKFFVDDLTEEGLMKLWCGRKDAPRLQSDQSAASDESYDPKPSDQSNHTEEQPPQEQAPDQPEPPPESHDQTDPWRGFKISHLSMQQLCSEMETIRTSSSCLQLL